MTNGDDPRDSPDDRRDRLDARLDEGLEETFPASDPVAIVSDAEPPTASDARGPADKVKPIPQAFHTNDGCRLDYGRAAPQGVAAFRHFNAYVENCGLEHPLLELVKTRASQINGCAYCLDMHTTDARAGGETEQRLFTLSAWRETPFFSARERAALAWTEAVTAICDGRIEDELYEEVRQHFSDKEIVDLSLAIVAINGWNRLAIPFRTPPGSYRPRQGGEKKPEG